MLGNRASWLSSKERRYTCLKIWLNLIFKTMLEPRICVPEGGKESGGGGRPPKGVAVLVS